MSTVQDKPVHLPPLEAIVGSLKDEGSKAKLYKQLLRACEREEPRIKAFEQRRDVQPGRTNGPFNGLPITVKDQIAVAGWPRGFGLDKPAKQNDVASAPFIQRLQELGCIVYGKTALPPYALDLQTFNTRRGATENPHKIGFTAGGSSGGGAAAVASGMSLLDIGSDLGGSLRLPASWCGVTSLVPTEGRLDNAGMLPKKHRLEHFGRMGPIARTAKDLKFFWETCCGEIYSPEETRDHRLLFWSASGQEPMEEHVLDLWFKLLDHLKTKEPPVETGQMGALFTQNAYQLFGEIMGYETGAMLPFLVRWLLRRDRQAIAHSENFLKHVYEGYRRDHRRHAHNLGLLGEFRENMLRQFEHLDALILPVSGIAAFPHLKPIKDRNGVRTYDKKFDTVAGPKSYLDSLTHFTVPVSLLGWPVITLPFAKDKNGVPLGLQLVGKPHKEAQLAAIACDLERTFSLVDEESKQSTFVQTTSTS